MNIETFHSSLLDLFLKSTVLLTLSLLMLAAFRRASAANRHAIAVAVFAGLLLLPGTKLMSPRWTFPQRSSLPLANLRASVTVESDMAQSAMPGAAVADPVEERWLDLPGQTLVVALWSGGVMLFLARRAWIGLRLSSMARRSRSLDAGRLAVLAGHVVQASGVKAEIRVSDECCVPLVSGILRPRVLLPAEAEEWSDELMVSALQHELGHVCRRDGITRLLANIVCAIYWLNPLVWFVARKLRLSQEHACDDFVLNAGICPEEYAGQLVEVVRNLQGGRFISNHAMAMAQPSTLEARVLAIVDETRDRSPHIRRGVLAGSGFIAVTLVLCTTAQMCGAVEKEPLQTEDKPASIEQNDKPAELISVAGQQAIPVRNKNAPQVLIESHFVEISESGAHPASLASLPEELQAVVKYDRASIAGVFTEKQKQTVMRQLTQRKGVDLMSAPTMITRSDQAGTIEVVRDFAAPSATAKGKQDPNVSPKKDATQKVGVTLQVLASAQPDNILDLSITPKVVEFEGFSKDKNGKQQPIFHERKISTAVTIYSGQTIVISLGSRADTQLIEDRFWFFFKKRSTVTTNRRVLVFVTAKIIKPVVAEKP